VVAVLAELSLIVPPGWASTPAAVVSLVLLVAVPAMMLLRRDRMPSWTPVLVPLAYAGSVLALLLTVGSTSGVAIVILIPLIWTGLYHRRWESACVVAAIVAVEITVSLVPVRVGDAVLFRRIVLWTALGTLISVATHGLRDSIRRAQEQRTRAEARLRELRVLEDRERIAADLQDRVVRRLHTAELALESAASMISGPRASRRIAAALQELDAATRVIRESVFGRGPHLGADLRLRQEIVRVCGEFASAGEPPPEFSFRGPVDSALPGESARELLEALREALTAIGKQGRPAQVMVTAGDDVCLTVTAEPYAAPLAAPIDPAPDLDHLGSTSSHLGIPLRMEDTQAGGMRMTWRFPAGPAPG
jgi:signal transduction histidine kinase